MIATSLAMERKFWNQWNTTREHAVGRVSREQRVVVLRWLDQIGRRDLQMIDVGCGSGWLCEDLVPYGRVVGTDLSDDVLARAAARLPQVEFAAGDFMKLDFGRERFDVAVMLETLSHVPDQAAFLAKVAQVLRPGGRLMLATQNRPVLEHQSIPAPAPGQRRRWVDRHELRQLLEVDFEVEELFSITPKFDHGALRLINSEKLRQPLESVGLSGVVDAVVHLEEWAWLGWTLMALARKRA